MTGLSPLARGTLVWFAVEWDFYRFIPAGAGNTRQKALSEFYDAVYPRWRGEHITNVRVERLNDGLSPLARGTLSWPLQHQKHRRFIPAGAGNTSVPFSRLLPRSVYPRWRGEHWFMR